MTAMENATRFFHACESLEGWQGCQPYTAPGATFRAQCEPLADVTTVQAYTDWMAGLGKGPLQGCRYVVNASAWDEANRTALFFATITGSHVGEGGPVPPTRRETKTDYVYALKMSADGKVAAMTKVWNATWTLRELGWV
jgi:hypothetical protein